MRQRKSLRFSKEYMQAVLSGRKTSTIRVHTKLKKGDEVDITVNGRIIGAVKILNVEKKPLKELTDEDARKDGFKDKAALLKALYKHYGKLPRNLPVYIIDFKLLKLKAGKQR
ncbi:MAG TPA: ASCH domain-containing protein [Candidatus Methanomethylia archaeon]|nr:ASCH domain-containing protein [Candidatus Methanomethylicia archaeon]